MRGYVARGDRERLDIQIDIESRIPGEEAQPAYIFAARVPRDAILRLEVIRHSLPRVFIRGIIVDRRDVDHLP